MTREERLQKAVNEMQAKCEKWAKDAIGCTQIIKQRGSNRSFKGTIVACIAHVEVTGWSLRGYWTVTLQGPTGLRETYDVAQIPRR